MYANNTNLYLSGASLAQLDEKISKDLESQDYRLKGTTIPFLTVCLGNKMSPSMPNTVTSFTEILNPGRKDKRKLHSQH